MKKNEMRMNGARIGFQSHYANLSGLLKNRSLLENNIKKQAKNDQNVFQDKNFIQRNAKFAVRSEKRTNFLRLRNPRNIIFQSFIEVSKFGFHFLAVIRIALDNRRVVHSKAHFVAFKTVMSICFRSEYS